MKATSYCVSCGVVTSAFGSPPPTSHLCTPCLEYHTLNNSLPDTNVSNTDISDTGHSLPTTDKQLKLWKVKVRGVKRQGKENLITHTIILAVDKNTAIERVMDSLFDSGILGLESSSAEEIEGPFKDGSIIEHKEF